MLAALWDELAASHSRQPFEKEFFPDLERLRAFQKTFPEEFPTAMMEALERRVIHAIQERFSKSQILQLRARLNSSN